MLTRFSPIKDVVVSHTSHDQKIIDRIPSSKVSSVVHYVVLFILAIIVLAYVGYVIYEFVVRTPTEEYKLISMSKIAVQSLNVTAKCSEVGRCGDITISVDYTASTDCKNRGARSSKTLYSIESQKNSRSPLPLRVDVCYTDDQMFSTSNDGPLTISGIVVEFSEMQDELSGAPFGIVTITHPSGSVNRNVNLDPWQVKTLLLGATKTINENGDENLSLYSICEEYDGKRPTSTRASLRVRLSPFANQVTISKKGTVFDILASIGGAVSVVGSIGTLMGRFVKAWFKVNTQQSASSGVVGEGDDADGDDGGDDMGGDVM